jgi:hypothetical protein
MTTFAIETNGLAKRFGNASAITCVDLRVDIGGMNGFFDLNGAEYMSNLTEFTAVRVCLVSFSRN